MRRVPLYLVIPLALGVVALPWWHWTKGMDFTTPPNDLQLARIRHDTAAAFSKPARNDLPGGTREPAREVQSPIKPPPVIDPGDPLAPAALDAFREHAGKGAKALVELAVHLEEQSGNARALLAWERVLDSCKPDESERRAAEAGIQRLRPLVAPWSVDPLSANPLLLDAALNRELPEAGLEGMLEEIARVTGNSSSGLVKFESRLEVPKSPAPPRKKNAKPKEPVPAPPPAMLSLQILVEGESAASTGVIELPVSADPPALRREILRGVYQLVASQLAATTDFTPPAPLSTDDDPATALATRITRLGWAEFGKSLQPPDRP